MIKKIMYYMPLIRPLLRLLWVFLLTFAILYTAYPMFKQRVTDITIHSCMRDYQWKLTITWDSVIVWYCDPDWSKTQIIDTK